MAVIDGLSVNLDRVVFFAKTSQNDFFVVFGTEQEVKEIQPNFSILANAPCRGIIITSARQATIHGQNVRDDDSIDFVSRFFGPAVGILEDPVTGSAHCTLGPYWSRILLKSTVVGKQLSKRTGIVTVQYQFSADARDEAAKQVKISGNAVVVSKSVFLCDMR
jgi:PhzF family phenazine biosynthesis protein